MPTVTLKVNLKVFVLVILALVCWIYIETEKRKILEKVISDKNCMLKNDFSKMKQTLAEISDQVASQLKASQVMEASEKCQKLENDVSKIKLTLAELSEVLERDVSELKEAISSVSEELKGLKTDFGAFKQFTEDTTGNTYDKVEEIHTIVTKSGLFESLKQVFRVLCGIASTLGYFMPKFHAINSLCSLSYYV